MTNGNFTSKDGWSHKYGETLNGTQQPLHAVTSRSKNGVTEHFTYDANGNQISAKKNGTNWRNITYSGRNKATLIEEAGEITSFSYDANNTRYKRTSANQIIYYVGGLELTIQSQTNTLAEETYIKRAIAGQALQTYYSAGNSHIKWLYKDHLGSLVAITNDQGRLLKRFTYDAFGRQEALIPSEVDRLLYYDMNTTLSVLSAIPMNIRGYTGHEPVGTKGRIIHMNGRIYDTALGRFMQADPFIQAPGNSQSYNRYAYVLNNPLTLTDPSGYLSVGDMLRPGKNIIRGVMRAIGKDASRMLVNIVSSYCGPWASACQAIGNYDMARAFGADKSDALRTGAIAGISSYIGQNGGAMTRAISGGVIEKAQGGKFSHGFWRSALNPGPADTGNPYANVVIDAVVGGSISRVTGGKFKNGAAASAFYSAVGQNWSSPQVEGSAEWDAREEAAFQKEQKQLKDGLASSPDLLAYNDPGWMRGQERTMLDGIGGEGTYFDITGDAAVDALEYASWVTPYAGYRAAGYSFKYMHYKNAGGVGLNWYRNGIRKFALEYHKFKFKGVEKARFHYHRGATKSQVGKHRPYQGGW